jgi:hypothetical protein|tara:strand:- start:287 stop:439 length:153 start_codon:yes stop_codon:yes gene_type:complete
MWAYTSDENSWLNRTGKSIVTYLDKVGTARASNRVAQNHDLLKSIEKHLR